MLGMARCRVVLRHPPFQPTLRRVLTRGVRELFTSFLSGGAPRPGCTIARQDDYGVSQNDIARSARSFNTPLTVTNNRV